jgi:hypothetical protein
VASSLDKLIDHPTITENKNKSLSEAAGGSQDWEVYEEIANKRSKKSC